MSRMLKALKQLEAGLPRTATSSSPASAGAGELGGTEATISAALQRVESAAAIAAEESAHRCSVEAGPLEAPPAEPPFVRWPGQPTQQHTRQYGKLADGILSGLAADEGAALMFTSPSDHGGTTEMLVPLAAALAGRATGGVLAVDANLRQPALAECLGVESTRGLADVLCGTADWQQVIRETAVSGLSVLPGSRFSGPRGRRPARLNLGPLLKELSGGRRLILVDAASLAHAEVAPMASWCTGVYLVVRLNHTTGRAVAEAVEALSDCGGRVLGSVLLGC